MKIKHPITGHKMELSKQKLTESLALLYSIIESPDRIVIFALDRNYCYTVFNDNHNQTMNRIWGTDIKIGMNMLEIIKDPNDRKKAKKNFERVLQGESFTLIEEYGEPPNRLYYEDIYSPVFDDTGEVIGLSLFITDITEKKKIEEELNKYRNRLEDLVKQRTQDLEKTKSELELDITERQQAEADKELSRSLLKAALESTADGILVINENGTWSGFNRKFIAIWGIPATVSESGDDKAALEYVLDKLIEPDEFLTKVRELDANPERDSFDTIKMKDGRIFERYSHPQRLDEKVVGRVWSFRDVTERKQAEEELKNHRDHLEKMVAERTRELKDKVRELDNAIRVFVGRELKIKELQERLNALGDKGK